MLTQAYVKGRWKGKRVPSLQADPWRVNGAWEGEIKGKVGREGERGRGITEVGYTRVANKLFHNITDKMLLVINTSNNGTLLVYILLMSVAKHG